MRFPLNWATRRAKQRTQARDRILVDGQDVTFWRMTRPGDQPMRAPGYELREPFAYGPSALTLPRFNAQLEEWPSWAREGATVKYQRVYESGTIVTDYVGRVLARRVDGVNGVLEIGGFIEGPANLIYQPAPVYRTLVDIGHHIQLALQLVNAPMASYYGPTTGFEVPQRGDMSLLAWLQLLGALAVNEAGQQRTVMPTEWGKNEWAFNYKNTTTVHGTVFADGSRVTLNVVDDATEKPNVYYAQGVNPEGGFWRNSKAPGVTGTQGDPPPYPFNNGQAFGIDTTDDDTDTGDGVDVLRVALQTFGYLSPRYNYQGVYTAEIAFAVQQVRSDAGLPPSDAVTTNVWDALFDITNTGVSIADARQHPVSLDNRVMKWNFSPSGHRLSRNASYDPGLLRVDRNVDMGPGVLLNEGAAWCRSQRLRLNGGKNWAGTITLNTGGFVGQHSTVASAEGANVMSPRDFRPGMNVWVPHFDGGTLFHISGVSVNDDDTATLTVDTKARDLPELREVLERRREGRRDVRREWKAENGATVRSSDVPAWDADLGGRLFRDVTLFPNRWNWVPVPVGQMGTISMVNIHTQGPPKDNDAGFDQREFAMVVCSRRVPGMGFHLGNPFAVDSNNESIWVTDDQVAAWIHDKTILYAAGTAQQPCGYGARRKNADNGERTSAPLTGAHYDDASWEYLCDPFEPTILWLGIYPNDGHIESGNNPLPGKLLAGNLFRHMPTGV